MNSRPFFLFFLGIFASLLLAFGCSEDPVTKPGPIKPNVFWTPIDLSGDDFMQLLYHEDRLYVAAARDGAFVQDPAFFGSWVKLERGFPEFYQDGSLPGWGPYALTFVQGDLYAGAFAAAMASVFRWCEADSTWVPTPDALNGADLYDLEGTRDGNLVASTIYRGVQVSEDEGTSWMLTHGVDGSLLNPALLLFDEPRGLYAGGPTALFYPILKRSVDGGLTWEDLTWKLPGSDGRITSLAESPKPPHPVYIFFRTSAYVASSDTASFVPILETSASGSVLLNPLEPMEVWVGSDSLYQSLDGGATWRNYGLPPGASRLGEAAADWERRLLAIVVWEAGGPGTVYCVNLDAPPDSLP
jgi:hypothetical protein